MKLLIAVFKFFASLRVAVVLLVLLGIAFAVGTFTESYYGTEAAQVTIYRTRWMAALLIFLALNLLGSALERIPWKKKHTGFLTTHLGIILILSGSLISQAFGIEGQLAIPEGKTGSRMTLTNPLIQIASVDTEKKWTYFLKRRPFAWAGTEKLSAEDESPVEIHLLKDYPKAKMKEIVEPAQAGSSAIHFTLTGSRASVDQWLFLEDPSRNKLELGPATVRFSNELIKPSAPKNESSLGVLKLNFESGISQDIPIDLKSAGKKFKIKATPFEIQIQKVLKDAVVDGNQLMERSGLREDKEQMEFGPNPALELSLSGNGLSETHTVFARFPEFPTLHGMKPSEAHVRISYEVPELQADHAAKNELRFIPQSSGLPKFQIQAGEKLTEGNVELGKELETGWMDFKFKVDQYQEHANIKKDFSPLPPSSQNIEAIPAVLAEFSNSEERKILWLEQGEIQHVPLGGSNYHVLYGLKTKPMGFQVELENFEIEHDPGTNRPASFKSLVRLIDPSVGMEREQVIQMNEPLKYRGFKVYQSAYQQSPGEPDVSIFTVARDPGNGFKYAGAVIMIAGIGMLFYVKSLSTLKGSDPKMRSK